MSAGIFFKKVVSFPLFSIPLAGNGVRVYFVEKRFKTIEQEKISEIRKKCLNDLYLSGWSQKVILCIKTALWLVNYVTFLPVYLALIGIIVDVLLELYCLQFLVSQ